MKIIKPKFWDAFQCIGGACTDNCCIGWEIDIDEELKTFLDEIISVFGKYDGDQLELMTHNEFPWKNARNNLDNTLPSNNKIQLKDIYNYYSAL